MITTKLNPSIHDRRAFDCGQESINTFIKERARNWERKGLANCWVLVDDNNQSIIGFYTLSAISLTMHAKRENPMFRNGQKNWSYADKRGVQADACGTLAAAVGTTKDDA